MGAHFYLCTCRPEEGARYPLLLSAYFFESGSLPDCEAHIVSGKLEASNPFDLLVSDPSQSGGYRHAGDVRFVS